MSSYAAFADYYDQLMQAVDYRKYAEYLDELLQKYDHEPGIVLDLACGTGNLTLELASRGYDIYGIDASPDMLSQAQTKAAEKGLQILFLCQKMQNIDLYGTINTVFCTMDSLNHLVREEDVIRTFSRVSLFLEKGGLFIFDVNTVYKHREVLASNTFVYDLPDIFCVWRNRQMQKNAVQIELDFFVKEDDRYRRSSECFSERAYEMDDIKDWLNRAGLELLAVYDALSFDRPADDSQRLTVVAGKI